MDNVTAQQRSRIMRRVKAKKTGPERKVLREVLGHGVPMPRLNAKGLPGSPDLAWRDRRLAVFVHGCFWHGCPIHYRAPKTRAEWWAAKLKRNKEHDRRSAARLRAGGWRVLTIWEHEAPPSAAQRIAAAWRLRPLHPLRRKGE